MSAPEERPPQRAASTRNSGSTAPNEKIAPSSGGPASGRTLGGNVKMRFTPKAVPRRAEGTPPAGTSVTKSEGLLGERSSNGPATRGRGRGRGRGEPPVAAISGPFAAGPAAFERRSTRQLRTQGGDTSVTVESAPAEIISAESASKVGTTPSTPQIPVKTEAASKPQTPKNPAQTSTRTRIKIEDDGYDLPDEREEEMPMDTRVDLAELNFPGGPVSSRRKNERGVRGWKKIELWIEQEEAEEIVVSDEESPPVAAPQIRVKVEDEPMGGIVVPEPEMMVIDDEEEDHTEKKPEVAKKSRARRQKKILRGKTREEKEELAREEIDTEVMRDQFLGPDASKREQKLFLLQLPLTLPPLRNITDVPVKSEVKTENPAAPTSSPATSNTPPSGKVGQLKVHASGKMVLSYGGINFPVRLASDVGFAQDFVVIDPGEGASGGKAWRLGSVGAGNEGAWLVGVPELKNMHKVR